MLVKIILRATLYKTRHNVEWLFSVKKQLETLTNIKSHVQHENIKKNINTFYVFKNLKTFLILRERYSRMYKIVSHLTT